MKDTIRKQGSSCSIISYHKNTIEKTSYICHRAHRDHRVNWPRKGTKNTKGNHRFHGFAQILFSHKKPALSEAEGAQRHKEKWLISELVNW
jgi:hypothetical protein